MTKGNKVAIIVLGPGQTGKTTLPQKIAEKQGDFLFLSGDNLMVKSRLESVNVETFTIHKENFHDFVTK